MADAGSKDVPGAQELLRKRVRVLEMWSWIGRVVVAYLVYLS